MVFDDVVSSQFRRYRLNLTWLTMIYIVLFIFTQLFDSAQFGLLSDPVVFMVKKPALFVVYIEITHICI